jgi:hypothetical protein
VPWRLKPKPYNVDKWEDERQLVNTAPKNLGSVCVWWPSFGYVTPFDSLRSDSALVVIQETSSRRCILDQMRQDLRLFVLIKLKSF